MPSRLRHEKFYKYYKEWVDTYKVGQIRDVTLKKYYFIAKWLKKYVPNLYLDEMTRGDVQRLVNKYGQTHEKQTVNDFLGHLKAPLRDAVYEGFIYRDPTYKVKATSTFKRLSTRQVCIQPAQVEKLLAVMKERSDVCSLLFDFALRTGLRIAELLGLTPNDVSFDQMVIRINKTWDYKSRLSHFQPCKNF